jgi:hypothetical protein
MWAPNTACKKNHCRMRLIRFSVLGYAILVLGGVQFLLFIFIQAGIKRSLVDNTMPNPNSNRFSTATKDISTLGIIDNEDSATKASHEVHELSLQHEIVPQATNHVQMEFVLTFSKSWRSSDSTSRPESRGTENDWS